jgi:hypothetical protein
MGLRAIIIVQLVDEAAQQSKEAIEKEILEEIIRDVPKIPWCKAVEKVTVTEA